MSDLDRQRASARVEELVAQGYIRDESEREERLRRIDRAADRRELNAVLDGLAGRRRERSGDRRASEADRKDAIRRLQVHGSMGRLDESELAARVEIVKSSKTPNEIAKVFEDLPALDAALRSTEPRISAQDKSEALDRLQRAHAEERIEDEEYEAAMSQVAAARTRGEIDAAFRCLPGQAPTEAAAQAARRGAALTTQAVREGGRRARKAFMRSLLAGAALLIGVILLIAGIGAGALLCFVAAVLIFAAAAAALVTRG